MTQLGCATSCSSYAQSHSSLHSRGCIRPSCELPPSWAVTFLEALASRLQAPPLVHCWWVADTSLSRGYHAAGRLCWQHTLATARDGVLAMVVGGNGAHHARGLTRAAVRAALRAGWGRGSIASSSVRGGAFALASPTPSQGLAPPPPQGLLTTAHGVSNLSHSYLYSERTCGCTCVVARDTSTAVLALS
eukprot:3653471-Pleurochrysis_carterae.AAC.1